LHGLPCCLTNVSKRLCNGTTWAKSFLAELTDIANGVVNRMHQALEDLRVAVER
jgi:hypothetical protein